MTVARVYVAGVFAGLLRKSGDNYVFSYDPSYPRNGRPVSLLFPPAQREHVSVGRLPPFFEGLMYEGWLRRLADKSGGDRGDAGLISYLIAHCADSVGDIEITADDVPTSLFSSAFTVARDLRAAPRGERERCLVCHEPLPRLGHNLNYHEGCSAHFFGTENPPHFDLGPDDIERLAVSSIASGIALPGVQPKLPIYYPEGDAHFILKPQVQDVRSVPECEHLWMQLAASLGVSAARSALVEMRDGSLAYVTKRFDRLPGGGKLHVEDFAQLLGKSLLGDEKFDGAIRDIAAAIRKHASIRLRQGAAERLIDLTVINFVFGNSDAHLKNHSLIGIPDRVAANGMVYTLAPAYDLLPTSFLDSSSAWETALTINGKRRNITVGDLKAEASASGVSPSRVDGFLQKIYDRKDQTAALMGRSFVPPGKVDEFQKCINGRLKHLIMAKTSSRDKQLSPASAVLTVAQATKPRTHLKKDICKACGLNPIGKSREKYCDTCGVKRTRK